MSKNTYINVGLQERRVELLTQEVTRLSGEFRSTRPRWQRKKGALIRRLIRTKKKKAINTYKLYRDEGIKVSQLNLD